MRRACPVRTVLLRGGALLLLLGSPLTAQRPESAPQPGVSAYLVVLSGGLNVRDRPTLDGRVVGVLTRGERVCVERYDGDWAQVVTPVGDLRPRRLSGFVSRGFVSETRATARQLEDMGCVGTASRDSRPG